MLLRFFGFLFATGVVVFVVAAAGVGYVLWHVSRDLPDYAVLRDYEPPVMTRVHAADGNLLAEYARERRMHLPVQAVPDRVIHAFLSAEDKNFYSHIGIDFLSIGRAVVDNIQNLRAGRRMVGASTITQQVAKNFLLSSEVTMERKLQEALLALRIENAFTKDEILELYLNEIYLGLGAYGIAAAALLYFDKSVHELTLNEAAYLAALPKAPSNYHPFHQAERAIERRNWVLSRMQENGYITAEEADAARATEIIVTPRTRGTQLVAADYFAEEVRRELLDRYGDEGLYEGGLSVRSTLDPELQVIARRTLADGLVSYDRGRGWRGPVDNVDISADWGEAVGGVTALRDIDPWVLAVVLDVEDGGATIGLQPQRLPSGALSERRDVGRIPLEQLSWARWASGERRGQEIRSATQVLEPGDVVYVTPVAESEDVYELQQVPEVGGAMVVMDPHTGRVLSLVGGFSFAQSEFNRATQAQRQPGSSFKPFIYAAALDNGYTPSSVVVDAPIEVVSGGRIWRPQNYGREFYGPSTLRRGIELSRNVMTVRLAQDMGMPLIVEYARRFGIYENLMPVLSMSLGAGETTVLRLTAAYAMLANGGRQIKPTLIDRIQDRYGRTIYKHDERECAACNTAQWERQEEPEIIDDREQILDPYTAYQMTSMLEGVVQRGTATSIREVGKPLAGKTGTTNDFRDAWFVGYSPDLAVGVFIGHDRPRNMGSGMTGGRLAAPVFRNFMQVALEDKPAIPFRVPPGIQLVRINANTGMRAEPGDSPVILEAFKPGQDPPTSYSVVGFQNEFGHPMFVDPQGGEQTGGVAPSLGTGTGGLY
jgi:penicillin-binding protein 1A